MFLIIALLFVCVVGWVAVRMMVLGVFNDYSYDNTLGQIEYVENIPLPADIAYVGDVVYVSSLTGRETLEPSSDGRIFCIQILDEGAPLVAKSMELVGFEGNLYPHGLDAWVDEQLVTWLYVVNYASGKVSTLEVFKVEGETLVHARTLKSPLLVSPYDVAVLDEEHCFVTNDSEYPLGWKRSLAIFAGKNRSSLIAFEGDNATVVSAPFEFELLTGVDIQNKTLVCADMLTGEVYRKDFSSDEWVRDYTNRGLASINVDFDWILIACHTNRFKLSRAQYQPEREKAPSLIYAKAYEGEGPVTEIVFADDGSRYSGASVGVMTSRGLLLGSSVENRLALVKLK